LHAVVRIYYCVAAVPLGGVQAEGSRTAQSELPEQVDRGVELNAAHKPRLTLRPEWQNQSPVLTSETAVARPIRYDVYLISARLARCRCRLVSQGATLRENAI
jgi:hypothetical protein